MKTVEGGNDIAAEAPITSAQQQRNSFDMATAAGGTGTAAPNAKQGTDLPTQDHGYDNAAEAPMTSAEQQRSTFDMARAAGGTGVAALNDKREQTRLRKTT